MMNQPGYPLPDGEAYTDDIVCQLVYLPNKDEYWQALLAGLHYFSTWKAWERDDDRRGADAARAWRESFELTMECWRMTCLDEITDRMDEIITLISLKKDCCDDGITYGPQTEVTTDIEPDVGDPPDYYGETAVTDWEDWAEHVCYNAHLYVDSLVWRAQEMDSTLQLGGLGIGVLAAALLALSFVGIGLAVSYALTAAAAAGILQSGTLGVFLTTAADIEDARDDIICAFLLGNSVADVVEDALGSASLDWLLFFTFVDYDSATSIIYEGGYGTEYLPAETRSDCFCLDPTDIHYTWDTDRQGWNIGVQMNQYWDAAKQALGGYPRDAASWMLGGNQTVPIMEIEFGVSAPILVKRIKYRIYFEANGEAQIDMRHRIRIEDKFFALHYTDVVQSSVVGWEGWVQVSHTFASTHELRGGGTVCLHNSGYANPLQTGQRMIIDDLRFYPD